jgi:hypothetical protein
MEVLVIAALVIFAVVISIAQVKRHKRMILEKVNSINGEIINIEKKNFSTGPFLWVKRGRAVYRIEYRKDNEMKEGWVKFGDLTGPDWRL